MSKRDMSERWVECDGCGERYGPDDRAIKGYLIEVEHRGYPVYVCRESEDCLVDAIHDLDSSLDALEGGPR